MGNKNFWGLLVNPFTRIAGWQAFGLGLVFVLLSGLFGTQGQLFFDGVLDAHLGSELSYKASFMLLAVDIASIVLVTWIIALIFVRDFRFVDILGTMTLARAPYILLAIASMFIPSFESSLSSDPMKRQVYLIIFGIAVIPIVIWYVTLMYNAIKVSLNIKGAKLNIIVIASILIGEVVSKLGIFGIAKLMS